MKCLFVYFFISGFLIFSVSCKNLDTERVSPVPDRKNYIRSYIIEPDSLIFHPDNSFITDSEYPINLNLSGKIVSEIENQHLFDSISLINKDNNFNKNYGLNLEDAPVLADTIYGIEIICDSDLNEIEAGYKIIDYVSIIYSSYDEILKSGYDITINPKRQETLTEFNKEPKLLVGNYFRMFFNDSIQGYKNKKYSIIIKLGNKELHTNCNL